MSSRHDLQGNFGSIKVFSLGTGVPTKISIDKTGYLVVGGHFFNLVTIGNLSRISNGANDLFLWRGKL